MEAEGVASDSAAISTVACLAGAGVGVGVGVGPPGLEAATSVLAEPSIPLLEGTGTGAENMDGALALPLQTAEPLADIPSAGEGTTVLATTPTLLLRLLLLLFVRQW